MKKIITFIALLVLLASCSATRKVAKTNYEATDSLTTEKVVSEQTNKIVDTTRTEQGKITITEIEFFPPTVAEPEQKLEDFTKTFKDLEDENFKSMDTSPKAATNANVDVHNFGNIKGSVKSIKQTVIESKVEEKGESEESSDKHESESSANVAKVEESSDKQQEPTPDPYRWRYIFYIALLCIAVLLYLKRTPFVNWIKKILQGIVKILQ